MDPIPAVAIWIVCGLAIAAVVTWEYRRWRREDWRATREREMAEAVGAREARQVAELEHLYRDVPAREPRATR